MINLSFTTMNALIHEPHTWLNKQMGLKTYQSDFMKDGKIAHKIIQDHVSGIQENALLNNLPAFPVVESEDFDPRCKVVFPIDGNYSFHGYVDGLNPETGEMLEVKSGRKWSVGDFQKLPQWKLYMLALPEFKKIWLVNVPRTLEMWNTDNIRVFNKVVTSNDLDDARRFIKNAIHVIENIDQYELRPAKKSGYCYYENCSYCPQK